jgi:hypothetical protein
LTARKSADNAISDLVGTVQLATQQSNDFTTAVIFKELLGSQRTEIQGIKDQMKETSKQHDIMFGIIQNSIVKLQQSIQSAVTSSNPNALFQQSNSTSSISVSNLSSSFDFSSFDFPPAL